MNYELMVIAKKGSDEESVISRVEKLMTEALVTGIKLERLGTKTFAYPIAKQTDGEYLLFNFEGSGETVVNLQNKLRLEREAILRYLIVKKAKVSRKKTKGLVEVESKTVEAPKVSAKVTVTTKSGPSSTLRAQGPSTTLRAGRQAHLRPAKQGFGGQVRVKSKTKR